ncbi:hypothetical protein [Aeromonas media]|uniref:hypothetical protein n=1 Tax=Aeromonas media TaxID=651 RepID=UPI00223F555D|nr:hypothetical protein [Aeromonas media]
MDRQARLHSWLKALAMGIHLTHHSRFIESYENGMVMKKRLFLLLMLLQAQVLAEGASLKAKDPLDFVPKGYVVFEKIEGDLNKDGQSDMVIVVKGTDNRNVIVDEYRGELDRNRRGLIIALNKGDHYELALDNPNCFSSENEDGGVYFAPELWVSVEKGILQIHYGHGRYGYWSYKFRYQNAGFELIGYDMSENRGPLVERVTCINFSTKKILIKENINQDAQEDGDETFKETWKRFSLPVPFNLKAVMDFDSFYYDTLYKIID